MPVTTAQRHQQAAEYTQMAVETLRRAIKAEEGLEWTDQLKDLLDDAEFLAKRLQQYADLAKAK